jgi:hypothetical protein
LASLDAVISAVVFCPQAPVVVPDLAQGAAAELDALREACRHAIRRAVTPGVQPVLVGAGSNPAAHESTARGTLAGFGVPLELGLGATDGDASPTLPASLTVGAWLVRDALGPDSGAIAVEVTDDHTVLPAFDRSDVALIVVGDGSARRTEKAPGYLDERAAEFDETVAAALARGDATVLLRHVLADEGGEELLVSGLAAWDAACSVVEGYHWDAELLYADAPYGVGYVVAVWTRRA